MFILMSKMPESIDLTETHFKDVLSELRAPSELAILSGLTVLEMCLVIACKHLQASVSKTLIYQCDRLFDTTSV